MKNKKEGDTKMAKKENFMEKKGMGMLITGLLLMGNVYWNWVLDPWMFVGILFTVFGLFQLFMK